MPCRVPAWRPRLSSSAGTSESGTRRGPRGPPPRTILQDDPRERSVARSLGIVGAMDARSHSRQTFPIREVAHAVGGAKPLEWDLVASGGYGRVSAHWRVSL